jgi:hypothetical protein
VNTKFFAPKSLIGTRIVEVGEDDFDIRDRNSDRSVEERLAFHHSAFGSQIKDL